MKGLEKNKKVVSSPCKCNGRSKSYCKYMKSKVAFYNQPWFWFAMMIIVICFRVGDTFVMAGNLNGTSLDEKKPNS